MRDAAARHEVRRLSRPDFAAYFREGIAHFNAGEFWEAHESWETIWLEAESELHRFLQGLIQIAAAYHHARRGTLPGAVRLFDAGLEKLSAFPPRWCGIDRTAVEAAARRHQTWAAEALRRGDAGARLDAGEWPRLDEDGSPMPPFECW